jgi:hypothetical protein
MLLAVLYFPVSGGRPALPVPSPAAISLLLTSLVSTAAPLMGTAPWIHGGTIAAILDTCLQIKIYFRK